MKAYIISTILTLIISTLLVVAGSPNINESNNQDYGYGYGYGYGYTPEVKPFEPYCPEGYVDSDANRDGIIDQLDLDHIWEGVGNTCSQANSWCDWRDVDRSGMVLALDMGKAWSNRECEVDWDALQGKDKPSGGGGSGGGSYHYTPKVTQTNETNQTDVTTTPEPEAPVSNTEPPQEEIIDSWGWTTWQKVLLVLLVIGFISLIGYFVYKLTREEAPDG